jgi:hypothetical protein
MDPLTLALIGGGLGFLKSGQDDAMAKKQNLLNAQIMRYSPWTGMHPNQTQGHGDQLGNIMQGALTGGMFGQALDKAGGAAASSPEGTTGGADASYNPDTYGSYDVNTGKGELQPKLMNQDMYQPGGEFYKAPTAMGNFSPWARNMG